MVWNRLAFFLWLAIYCGCGEPPGDRQLTWSYIHPALVAPSCATSSCHSSLARTAATDGWSVRVTEDRARATNSAGTAAKPGKAAVHPDALAAADILAVSRGLQA